MKTNINSPSASPRRPLNSIAAVFTDGRRLFTALHDELLGKFVLELLPTMFAFDLADALELLSRITGQLSRSADVLTVAIGNRARALDRICALATRIRRTTLQT